jgi:hypothetical protein
LAIFHIYFTLSYHISLLPSKNYPASPKIFLTHLQTFIYHSIIAYIHPLPSLPRKNYPTKFTLVYFINCLPIKNFFIGPYSLKHPHVTLQYNFFFTLSFLSFTLFFLLYAPLPYNPTPASILEFLSKTNIYIKIPSPHSYSALPPPSLVSNLNFFFSHSPEKKKKTDLEFRFF